MMLRALLLIVLLASTAASLARGEPPTQSKDDVPLDTYLDALAQISPAAREGLPLTWRRFDVVAAVLSERSSCANPWRKVLAIPC